jgi:VWFA-related protein
MRVRWVIVASLGLALVSATRAVSLSWTAAFQETARPLFSTRSELVVLDVTVKDRKGAHVMALPAEAFVVEENGQRQAIRFFGAQDAPVTVGLLIDSSGSMAPARDLVGAAVAAFVETSNPEDQVFALAFNEYVRPVLTRDAPFTSDADALGAAVIRAMSAVGLTALHDAVFAGLDHVRRGDSPRTVLVVLGDGADNVSTATFDEVLARIHGSNTVIYTIAFPDPLNREANPRRLRQLAEASGGEAFVPRDVTDVSDVLRGVARDIRHAYTLGYEPPAGRAKGRFHRVRVTARAPDGRALVVHTRQGYTLEER